MKLKILQGLVLAVLCISCSNRQEGIVHIGRLEAEPLMVTARTTGELLSLEVEEGSRLQAGDRIGQIDSEKLELQRRKLASQEAALKVNLESALLQIDQAEAQLDLSRETLVKTERLLKQGGAAVQKRDELATQVDVGQSSLEILKSNYRLIQARQEELQAGIELADLSIKEATLTAPVQGTVLNRYYRIGELVAAGTPVVEIADLSVFDCYVYLPLRELAKIDTGEEAQVFVTGIQEPYSGTVAWISPEGEFTPKSILTEETRDTLVYEVKLRVENPRGELKIGMPVDVRF